MKIGQRPTKKQMQKTINGLISQITKLKDALIWCSGSQDFQVGGKARKGWKKIAGLCN